MTVNAITDTKKGRTGIAPTYLHTTRRRLIHVRLTDAAAAAGADDVTRCCHGYRSPGWRVCDVMDNVINDSGDDGCCDVQRDYANVAHFDSR